MYNAVNKSFIALLLSATIILPSCGDSRHEQALQLSERAECEIKSGNYQAAIILLDTLDRHYASQVDIRRSAMKYRAMAVEGLTIRNITVIDDSLAVIKARLDDLESQFEYIKNPGKNLGGNYVFKPIAKSKSNILPRINDDGYFTLSITVPNASIGLNSIRFQTQNTDFTTPIATSRIVKVENSEMTVLQQEEISAAIEWLEQHSDANSYQLAGSKKSIKEKLSGTMLQAIIKTYRYALDRQAYTHALIEREKLERRLQLARNQLANSIDK